MESADTETTITEEKGVMASPRMMKPTYFLPQTNWRGTTMLVVGEENTRPSRTRVLDHPTGDEGICFLAQTV